LLDLVRLITPSPTSAHRNPFDLPMTTPQLDIKVIYDAASGGRPTPRRVTRHLRVRSGSAGVVLGCASLAVASLLYYATWWQVDRQIYMKLMLHMPVEGVSAADVSRLLGLPPEPSAQADAVRVGAAGSTATAKSVQTILGTTGYGWLTLATLSACAVALSGAAAVARGTEFELQRVGFILGGGAFLALAWGVATTWADYGMEYKPHHLRYAMSAPVAIAACLGLILSLRARLFARVAGISLILAAIGSVVALWLGHRCEAVDAAQVTVSFLSLIFTAHSAWGWILLFLGARWTR